MAPCACCFIAEVNGRVFVQSVGLPSRVMTVPVRGMQLMLAIANGAFILQPSWVTASREAGRWLPEEEFASTAEFVAKDGKKVT